VRNVDLENIYVAQDGTDAKVTKVCVCGWVGGIFYFDGVCGMGRELHGSLLTDMV
jgi:hypothetical protein